MPSKIRRPSDEQQPALAVETSDEVDEVLTALRGLLERTGSPVVRVCLEEAHDDIAHLTNRDGLPQAA
jgi:hypothetical protein